MFGFSFPLSAHVFSSWERSLLFDNFGWFWSLLTLWYCALLLCGINGVGGGDNIGFIDFGDIVDKVGKQFFGDPLFPQFTIFAVLTEDEVS